MLKPENGYQIPEETVKVAKVAFPNGNIYLALRDNRSEERRVGKSVDIGGRRIIKKKNITS